MAGFELLNLLPLPPKCISSNIYLRRLLSESSLLLFQQNGLGVVCVLQEPTVTEALVRKMLVLLGGGSTGRFLGHWEHACGTCCVLHA